MDKFDKVRVGDLVFLSSVVDKLCVRLTGKAAFARAAARILRPCGRKKSLRQQAQACKCRRHWQNFSAFALTRK